MNWTQSAGRYVFGLVKLFPQNDTRMEQDDPAVASVLLMVLNSPKVGAVVPTWYWNGLGIEKMG
jgi:hypothetical protein